MNSLDYQLFVSLPVGYSEKDTTSYPVLFVLDAPDNFWLAQAMTRFLGEGGANPRMILVGVGYPDSSNQDRRRQLDLTPTRERGASATASGGAAEFLETFRRDFIPFIEKTYRARQDRALLGHSFGGLFAVYTLFAAPELFDRYGILSPATWWDNHQLLGEVSKAKQPRIGTAVRAFVAVGADEDVGMRGEADSVTALLKLAFGTKLTLTSRRYPGNHTAYLPEAVGASLKFLFPAQRCLDSLATGGRSYTVLTLPDRVEAERFVRRGTTVSGAWFLTGGACFRYDLTSDPSGRVVAARLQQNPGSPRTTSVRVDSAGIRFQMTDPAQERSIDARGPTSLFAPRFLGSIDPLVRLAPSHVGDTTRIQVSNFLRADTATAVITRISHDSVRISHRNVELRVHVSPELDMLGGTVTPRTPGSVATHWIVVPNP